MTKGSDLRFGVFNDHDKRAGTWNLFWRRSKWGLEIYLANRRAKRFKTSFHATGKCHAGFDHEYYHSDVERYGVKSRFGDEWDWPSEIAEGVTLLYQIHTLPEAARTEDKSQQKKGFVRIPEPVLENHIRVTQILVLNVNAQLTIKARNLMNVGELVLDDGRKICVCSMEMPKPIYPEFSATLNLLGQSKEDVLANKESYAGNFGLVMEIRGIPVRTTLESIHA